jgi:hypothetical protein
MSRSKEKVVGKSAHVLSLSDELASIKLRHDTFQHLVDYRWEHPFIVVASQLTENLWQCIDGGTRQDTACDVDHLEIWSAHMIRVVKVRVRGVEETFCACETGNAPRFGTNVENDGSFKPRYLSI